MAGAHRAQPNRDRPTGRDAADEVRRLARAAAPSIVAAGPSIEASLAAPGALFAPAGQLLGPSSVLRLQRTHGNAFVQGLLGTARAEFLPSARMSPLLHSALPSATGRVAKSSSPQVARKLKPASSLAVSHGSRTGQPAILRQDDEEVGGESGGIWDTVSGAADWASDTAGSIGQAASGAVEQAADWAGDTAGALGEAAGGAVQQATDWAAETAGEAGATAQETAGDVSDWVAEQVSGGGEESSGLIVEDDVADPGPTQLRKSDFLAAVRTAVDATVAAALGDQDGAGTAAEIDGWFARYAGQSAEQLEGSIREQVPGAGAVPTAHLYVPLITARVAAALAAGDAGADENADATGTGTEPSIGDLGGMLFKTRPGGPPATADARTARARLGQGQALDAPVRSAMSEVFGQDFSHVRVHAGGRASRMADDLNAHAFAVGHHIAFGAGEYRPGTPVGDALIAHELAHVVQQGAAPRSDAAVARAVEDGTMEADADQAATQAMLSLWGRGRTGLSRVLRQAMPRLRSGLALQSCKRKNADCAHPINARVIGNSPAPSDSYGMNARYVWEANPGHSLTDLKACEVRERLLFSDIPCPPFTEAGGAQKEPPVCEKDKRSGQEIIKGGASGAVSGMAGAVTDRHSFPRFRVMRPLASGKYTVKQDYEYHCPDCGDDWTSFGHFDITMGVTADADAGAGGKGTFTTRLDGPGGPLEQQDPIEGR